MINIDKLRRLALDGDLAAMQEIILRLEAAEKSDAESLAMYRKARDERDALRAKIEQMDEAMESLLIRCDDSDSAMYGILSTSYVRDTVRIARGALEESE